jgi:hypothetical protein
MQNAGGHASEKMGVPHEKKFILLFCFLAAIHVFIFSAAFPFFNNVDEPVHCDLVLRYSNGKVPRGPALILKDTVEYIAFYNSWSYNNDAPGESLNSPPPAPLWTESPEKKSYDFQADCAQLQFVEDYEVSQTPLYYSAASAWWDAGKGLGIHGGRLLYWLRFFNIIEIIALVWLAYLAARMVFPEKPFIRLGAPALLIFMPQTAFYSIGNDILPALCFGIAFICLLKWPENLSLKLGLITGLAFAAAWLAKETTLPQLAVAVAFVLFETWRLARRGKTGVFLAPVTAFLFCAAVPIVSWMIWSKIHFGDFTGSKLKMEHFGWTIKSFGEWWHHPIFTPAGFWTYLSGQFSTFWQGEFFWNNQPLILPGTRAIYTMFSLVLMIAALPTLLPDSPNVSPSQRRALLISVLCFAAGLGFFALMSVAYDFHDCPYPSRHYPYFTSGRLLLGALIPFLLLIVYGLDRLLMRFGNTAKFLALAAIMCAMLAVEIMTDWPVFSSPYNWFHLP